MNLFQKQGTQDRISQNKSQNSQITGTMQINDPNRKQPNLIRINADNQDKKFMCIFWTVFIVFIIVFAIVGKTVPSSYDGISNSESLEKTALKGCNNPNNIQNNVVQCGGFTVSNPSVSLVANGLSSLNQFVMFQLLLRPNDMKNKVLINQTATIALYTLSSDSQNSGKIYSYKDLIQNQSIQFQFNSDSSDSFSDYIYDGKNKVGYKKILGFLGQFPANDLYFNFYFNGSFAQMANVSSLELDGYNISKGFTQFTIVVRYLFFGTAVLALILYIRRYKKIPVQDRTIQQKLIMTLSILLIFFNDPFYPITVLKENMASSVFSTLFVITFIVFLIFLWVIFFDRILYQEGQKQTDQIKIWKVGYFIVLYTLLMILYVQYAAYRINGHPLIASEKLNTNIVTTLQAITGAWFALVLLYLLIQYIRICCKKEDKLWRNQLFMLYSAFFQVALMIFIFTDNALGSYSYNGVSIMFVYGLMNLYTWYLQYMYSPAPYNSQDAQQKLGAYSDQRNSVGTIQFNDLNINLDDGLPYRNLNDQKQLPKPKQVKSQPPKVEWSKNLHKNDDQMTDENENNFSIQDQDQQQSNHHKYSSGNVDQANRQKQVKQAKQVRQAKQKLERQIQQARQRSQMQRQKLNLRGNSGYGYNTKSHSKQNNHQQFDFFNNQHLNIDKVNVVNDVNAINAIKQQSQQLDKVNESGNNPISVIQQSQYKQNKQHKQHKIDTMNHNNQHKHQHNHQHKHQHEHELLSQINYEQNQNSDINENNITNQNNNKKPEQRQQNQGFGNFSLD